MAEDATTKKILDIQVYNNEEENSDTEKLNVNT